MSIDWKNFPSLTALRAFEAAARLQSFSRAARDLNVTHAAIAQQVRSLESDLGHELIYRQGRGLALTAKGARLAQALFEGFHGIEVAVQDLRGVDPNAPLRVTMTPAFAAQWLIPHLGAFWAANPQIALTMHPDHHVVDLRERGIELAIRFGGGVWPGVEAEFLTSAQYRVVGAPSLLQGRTKLTASEMSAMPWVIESDWPEALAWLHGFGLKPSALNITYVPTEELALSAARQGFGLHVEAAALMQKDLDSGELVEVGQISDESLAYYLVTLPGPKRANVKAFIKWIKAAI